jgi:hypothetical protein
MSKIGAALKHIADTGAPLYQSLNDAQKNRFTMLAHILRPHHHMHARNEGDGGWHEGHGYGREGGGDGHWFGHEGHRFGQDGRDGWPDAPHDGQ